MPKVVFGNFVNQLMTAVPAEAHVHALTAPSARKIWYAEPGDIIVLPRPPDEIFLSYACAILGMRRDDVAICVPPGCLDEYLATRVLDDPQSLKAISQFRDLHPAATLELFAQDEVSVGFCRRLGFALHPYSNLPSKATLSIISRLNTKSGFKDLAGGLGVRVVPGGLATGPSEAKQVAQDLFEQSGPLVVKIDRGSNGYGHYLVRDQRDLSAVESSLNRYYEQPDRFVVEPLLPFTDLPSIEYQITDSGPHHTYTCNMRCINNAWTGMTTPAHSLTPASYTKLESWGSAIATFLFERGYRGIFDVDCGITEGGELFATESNCRNTGGTYIHFLLKRLLKESASTVTWLADSRLVDNDLSFEGGVDRIAKAGLAWNSASGTGVIFTSNTRHLDRKWRYVIIGNDEDNVRLVEAHLMSLLTKAC